MYRLEVVYEVQDYADTWWKWADLNDDDGWNIFDIDVLNTSSSIRQPFCESQDLEFQSWIAGVIAITNY